MDWKSFFVNMPAAGWGCVFILLFLVGLFLFGVYKILKTKNLRIKNIELTSKVQQELYQTEGKNLLDNQCSNAHNLLRKIWIDIYETGKEKFGITEKQELFILEDISHLIEGKLNYEVKNDLTRNHITEKSDIEIARYSDAKAVGYYRAVKASLYAYNVQLPHYDLPLILDEISVDDYKKLFSEIYFSARKIAGGRKNA